MTMEEGFDIDPAEPEGSDAPVRHQPASAADLRRHPPAGPRCETVRGLLRSYADLEATPSDREAVEEHVHLCRDCAVALSRVEAEVYRLRRAFEAPASGVPRDFVRNVMMRVREEHAAEAASAADPEGDVSFDFTPRVMERIRREWKRPSLAARLGTAARRHTVLFVAAAAAAAVLLWSTLRGPGADPGLHVQSAEGGVLCRGDRETTLLLGEALVPGDGVRLDPQGRATVVLPGRGHILDRARLEFGEGAALQVLARGEQPRVPLFRLATGSVAVEVEQGERLVFALADDVRVDLESGSYSVFAFPVIRHDSQLTTEPLFQAVRLAALAGRARIQRGQDDPVGVDAGFAAHFDGWSSIRVERCLDDTQIRDAGRRDVAAGPFAPEPAPTLEDWLGRVVNGKTLAGVAGATVTVRAPGQTPRTVFTAEDGSFRLENLPGVEGMAALVDVVLPEGGSAANHANVANFSGPISMRAVAYGPRRERRLDPIALPPERHVVGKVFDPDGRPLRGARVTPVYLDELAGSAKRLVAFAVTSDDGHFVLRRLPEVMPPHVSIYLLVEHADHGAVAAMDLLDRPSLRDQSISVSMVRRRTMTISDLPPDEGVEILASIRNLAPSAMLLAQAVAVPAAGVVDLEVAEGASVWLRHGGELRALAPRPGQPDALERVDAPVSAPVAALASTRRWRGRAVIERSTWRYDSLFTGGTERRTVALMDRQGNDLAGAQLFLVSKADGATSYVGEMTAAQAEWMLPGQGEYRMVVVTDDGAVGVAELGAHENILRIIVQPLGSARLPADMVEGILPTLDRRGGFAVFELRMVEPLSDYVVLRHVGRDSGFEMQRLIPGKYRMLGQDGKTTTVLVPPGPGQAQFIRD